MAFNSSNFSMRGYLYNGGLYDSQITHIGEWDYSTSDSFSSITSGYFNSVSDKIRPGDFIHVNSSVDGNGVFYVTNVSNPAGFSGTQHYQFS